MLSYKKLKEGFLYLKKYLIELFKRKDLLFYLVISGMKSQYRNSYLGYVWWILDPLLMGLVYYFLRVAILGMKGEFIGAFLIIGLLAWKWLQSALSNSARSIISKSGIITQVYLPKAIFPFGTTMTELFNFSFGLVAIAFFLVFYRLVPSIYILWLPVIMFVQFIFLAAISLVLAYYATFVRDIDNLLSHLMRFWFYASPVIWEADRIPKRFSFIVDFNPAATFIKGYRNIFMYNSPPDLEKLFLIGLVSMVLIIYMLYFYSNNEHKLIKAL
jgi:ABC-type polysaccharide/polyol phosphate export permease